MFLDFIEIGTSDFNTLIQAAGPNTRGLDTHLRLNLNRLKGERATIQTAQGYYLEGYPKNYSPLNLPHENNLDSALKYASQQQAAGFGRGATFNTL
eukprot:gene4317-4225_t